MKRNKFSLSHYHLLTGDMGQLLPVSWYEVLPGDTIRQSTSSLIRLSPLNAPIMHPIRIRMHHFYVPLRLIWDDFEDFITGGRDGTSTFDFPHRQMQGQVFKNTLYDYLGIPMDNYSGDPFSISMLPFRAYWTIYNAYYRDQDLIDPVSVSTASGPDFTTPRNEIAKASWSKDYFTTSRPWPQKGPDITIPIGDSAPVLGIGKIDKTYSNIPVTVHESDGEDAYYPRSQKISALDHETFYVQQKDLSDYPNIHADLTQATGVTINDLRLAMALQRYEEARAMYGSRYVEYLRHLGVRSSDARLQNPEYLGGGRQVLQTSEIVQTAMDSTAGTPVGTLRGHGIAPMRTRSFRRFFEEHGIVMSLMSVVPKSIYTSGIHKSFRRQIKEDYFQHELQNLGDQEVYDYEINSSNFNRYNIFGYQSRYDDYRSLPSRISGDFHDVLDYWHLGREFSGEVALNQGFVDCTPTKRIFADTVAPAMQIMTNHHIQARRMLSSVSKPRTF